MTIALFLAILYEGLLPFYVTLFFVDRARWARAVLTRADEMGPQFRLFIDEVAKRTPPGSTVAILYSTLDWNKGYSYAFFRATYLLAGRQVVPLADPAGRYSTRRLAEADYVAAWGGAYPPPDGQIIWRGLGGELVARRH